MLRTIKWACRATLTVTLAWAALEGTATAETPPKAAILLPGSINDHSWNALGYSILQSLKAHGYEVAYSEGISDADESQALRD